MTDNRPTTIWRDRHSDDGARDVSVIVEFVAGERLFPAMLDGEDVMTRAQSRICQKAARQMIDAVTNGKDVEILRCAAKALLAGDEQSQALGEPVLALYRTMTTLSERLT